MLVLTRKPDQTIMIGDSIKITVLDVRGDHIRLGIDAPRDIAIYRKEIYDQIQEENAKSAASREISVDDLHSMGDVFKGKKSPLL